MHCETADIPRTRIAADTGDYSPADNLGGVKLASVRNYQLNVANNAGTISALSCEGLVAKPLACSSLNIQLVGSLHCKLEGRLRDLHTACGESSM